ncbi:pyruvate dehydrogenase [acetyl-transferring]-phosphatase 1, mitochondrial-like [Arctopsyche grandis]|uniref:pyruvate dehydrogenase [acetyl-transferring]-phosphatase 1, mitochondrial-like n=1 Tax=Arctopsyche grandis TaxID=121162 RepID=UPI00406D6F31
MVINSTLILRGVRTFRMASFSGTAPMSSAPIIEHLTAAQISAILRYKEVRTPVKNQVVKMVDFNQLPSNDPCEDTHFEAKCLHSPGYIFGVCDGHGGQNCSIAVSKRLKNYIAASLLPAATLKKITDKNCVPNLVQAMSTDTVKFTDDLQPVFDNSFKNYLKKLILANEEDSVEAALETAFLQLDDDISTEILATRHDKNKDLHQKLLSVGMSGCVTCVAYINGLDLYVANVGDSGAVLGSLNEEDEWEAIKLVYEHNADNAEEVEKIIGDHPPNERESVIRNRRLLGTLAPLRSIGDYQYKFSRKTLQELCSDFEVSSHYQTPPYLSAKPDIQHHRLTNKDKFLILASDGLWDMVTPTEVVSLVGHHLTSTVEPKKFVNLKPQIWSLLETLDQMAIERQARPDDSNGATHLLRHALGGINETVGERNLNLSRFLKLPSQFARKYRDDITITIVYFNQEQPEDDDE